MLAGGSGGVIPFRCEATEVPGATVVRATGELELATVGDLEKALDAAVRAGRHVAVDLSELSYLDSTGLRALITYSQLCHAQRLRLAVVTPAGAPGKLFRTSGLDRRLPLFDSLDAALQFLREGSASSQ